MFGGGRGGDEDDDEDDEEFRLNWLFEVQEAYPQP